MKIKWLGHASFFITTEDGTRIITDPFDPEAYGDSLTYPRISEAADIVTVSHSHPDHNWAQGIDGKPEVVAASGQRKIGEVKLWGVEVFHDPQEGRERGENIMFMIEADGLRIFHCGDLGHVLSDEILARIGNVNIRRVPVGGFYTIDAIVATDLLEQLHPNVVVPMHYQTERCSFPIEPVETFLEGKLRVRKLNEAIFSASNLPGPTEIWVLEHP